MRRKVAALTALVFASAISPLSLGAHAVVYPKVSTSKAYERYVLRVPNERDVATTRIEIRFPRSVRVSSFAEVPGWTLEILRDSAQHVIGAAWTGSLPPERFVELPFVGVNPDKAVKLLWPVFQTYSSGERVDWVGAEKSKQPASITTVESPSRSTSGLTIALWVCIAALVLSLISLALAVRPENRVGSPPRA
jgi:uncharacterized protein YcnI